MNSDHVQFLKNNGVKVGALAVLVIAVAVVFIINPFGEKGTASAGGPGDFTTSVAAPGGKTLTPEQQKKQAEQVIQQQQEQAAEHIRKKRPSGGS